MALQIEQEMMCHCGCAATRTIGKHAVVEECGWCGRHVVTDTPLEIPERIGQFVVKDVRISGDDVFLLAYDGLTPDGDVFWLRPEDEKIDPKPVLAFVTAESFDMRLDELIEEAQVLEAEFRAASAYDGPKAIRNAG